MRIDLHTHSTVSDGTLPPAEVIKAAAAADLDVVALTDHDNLAGWPEAAQAAGAHGIEFVPGVEISCRWYGADPPISLHLLGYWVDPGHGPLQAELARVREARERRAQQMVELMRADGVDVTWDEVQGYAAGGTVGRPHLAQALIRRGLADTVSEAFSPQLLGRRWRVPKPDTDVFVALDLIRHAGGVSVFAHPRATRRGRVVPDSLIVELSIRGLAGLEADHEDHSPEEREAVRALAADVGILVTGSSDFHGTNKSTPIGANLTDPMVYEALRAAAHTAWLTGPRRTQWQDRTVAEVGVVEGQPGLFPEPTRLFTCTPSRLGAFEDCPRRYRFTYLDRPTPPKGPPWAHNSLGASVHTALKGWFDLPPARRTPAAVDGLLRATWVREGYRDEEQERQTYGRALQWLLSYVGALDPSFEPLGVERTVATRTPTLALSGRVDRLDDIDGELVVVDYKTGRTGLGPDDARSSRALALYAVAASRLFRRPCRRVELHHLPTGTVAAHEHTEESLARHLRRAEQTAADAMAAERSLKAGADPDDAFPTKPGAICGWCDFRRACPVGATRQGNDPWAGLDRGLEPIAD